MGRGSLLVLLAIGMIAVSSCSTAQPNLTEKPIVNKDPQTVIVESLKALPEKMRSAVVAVNICDEDAHYNSVLDDGKWVSAHCHHDRKICIKSQVLIDRPEVLWHEAAHAYTRFLCDSNKRFLYDWCCIKGGELTPYGQESALEDIAEWTEQVYLIACGKKSVLDDIKRKSARELAPCQLKLITLWEYGFIDKSLYDKVTILINLIKKP